MSAFTQNTIRRVASLQVPRTLTAVAPRAAFSTTVQFQKTATETAKDALKTVDRAVSDKLVDGIDIAATVGTKVKKATEDVAGVKNPGAAAELRGEAKGKANEYAGEAKGTANKVSGEAKGRANDASAKANELVGEAKGKANELAGEAKGKYNELAGKAQGKVNEAQRKL